MTLRKLTQPGVAPPSQVNRRPAGKYRVQAPDAPVGSILRVTTRDGQERFAELVVAGGERLFVDTRGNQVGFADWDYATRAQVDRYRLELTVALYADEAELCGAPAFADTIRAMPAVERFQVMTSVARELRERGKPGKAEQVLAYLVEE